MILRRLLKMGRAAPAACDDATAAWRLDVAACAGAGLFALHPLQAESVAWISEGRGLLCALFRSRPFGSTCGTWPPRAGIFPIFSPRSP